ncbi:MAG TPA: hypothetical protein VD813_05535 [Pseudonocardia sp.]|nr:hypothetical protein [Pseudonocardia sp.]
MATSVPVFSLYRYRSADAGCAHHLLVRVSRPGYSNADQGAEDAADAFAASGTDHLRTWWARWRLPLDCRAEHTAELVGVMQEWPTADELSGRGLGRREVWVCPSGYGSPWVVLDTAEDEPDFWDRVRQDPDLASLRPRPPVTRYSVYLLTDEDGGGDLSER